MKPTLKPILINNLDFAQKEASIKGAFGVAQCERLLESLAPLDKSKPKIQYELAGYKSKLHLPSLHLKIVTQLPFICQRCIEDMHIDYSLSFNYVISDTEPSEDESDEVDWLEAAQEMNLAQLIEDELIVATPIAPLHAEKCVEIKTEAGEKPNPFSVLKTLKSS